MLASEHLLELPLSLPKRARSDIRSAAALRFAEATPFASAELLIHTARLRTEAGFDHWRLTAIPRATLLDHLKTQRIDPRRLRRLTPAGDPKVDFLPLLYPWARRLRWSALVAALLIIAGSYVTGSLITLSRASVENATAEAIVANLRAKIRDDSVQLDQRRAATEAQNALATRMSLAAPPAYDLMLAVTDAMPDDFDIQRFVLNAGVVSVTLRAPDILTGMQAIAAALTGWTVSIDGAISRDEVAGTDTATLLLKPPMAP